MAALMVNEGASERSGKQKLCEALAPKAAAGILALGQGRLSPVALGTVGQWALAQGIWGPPCLSDLALSRLFPRRV